MSDDFEALRARELLDRHADAYLRCVRAVLAALPSGGPKELTTARDELAEYVERRARRSSPETAPAPSERPSMPPKTLLEENQEKRETAVELFRGARAKLRGI